MVAELYLTLADVCSERTLLFSFFLLYVFDVIIYRDTNAAQLVLFSGYSTLPSKTRCRFDVDTTLFGRQQR